MKSVSEEYIAKEKAVQHKPVELYKIWQGDSYFYHTNGDSSVEFEGNTYTPATISRGSIQYNAQLEANSIEVTFSKAFSPVLEFIAANPATVLWIEVSRLFRDLLSEKSILFIGQIQKVTVKGVSIQATCVGLEFFLRQPIPTQRYQVQCNWDVFSPECGKSSSGFQLAVSNVTVDGLRISHSDFGTKPDNFFKWGRLSFHGHERLITEHTGNVVTIRYPIPGLVSGESVFVLAGCDGKLSTCQVKFDNIGSFGGFPYIPLENPVVWTD